MINIMKKRPTNAIALTLIGVALGVSIGIAYRNMRRPPVMYFPVTKSPAEEIRQRQVNIRSRKVQDYRQIGLLYGVGDTILPLFGRQTYTGSPKWNYYTLTNENNIAISIPLSMRNRDCTETIGCSELYTDDIVNIPEMQGAFSVRVYKNTMRYIPSIL